MHLRNRIVPMSACRGFRFAALLLIASVSGEVLPLQDDECWAGGCSLQTLQLQAQVSGTQNASSDYERSCTLVDCRKNKQDKRCGYYRRCVDKKNRKRKNLKKYGKDTYCSLANGKLTSPAIYFSGSEDIQTGKRKASRWDWLWYAARKGGCKGGGLKKGCALLSNPECPRDQDQFHIHNRPFTKAGWKVQKYLTSNICNKQSWRKVYWEDIGSRKLCDNPVFDTYAKYYPSFPKVFSEAKQTEYIYGLGGFSVWPVGDKHGCKHGYVLMLTRCQLDKLLLK